MTTSQEEDLWWDWPLDVPKEPEQQQITDTIDSQSNSNERSINIEKSTKAVIKTPQRDLRKIKRAAGESYIDRKNRVVPAKQPKLDDCKCRFACRIKITEEQQQTLFNEYWSIRNLDKQKSYLCSLISESDVRRRRKRSADSDRGKQRSRVYSLKDTTGSEMRVCLKFFCNTFAISPSITNNALANKSSNGEYIGRDKRKGRPAPNATPEHVLQHVRKYIESFPTVLSERSTKKNNRLYLWPDVNSTTMFRLYSQDPLNPRITESVFRIVFNSMEPRLSTFKSRKDQCKKCLNAKRDKNPTKEYEDHVLSVNGIKKMKSDNQKNALNNPRVVCGSFDLQATLTLPQSDDPQIYYKRKLCVFNFAIYDSLQNGTCYLWDETHGQKGSAEIATCLLNYIQDLNPSVEHLILYADAYEGQSHKQNLVACLLYALNKQLHCNLKIIDIKYMENGHCSMEADSIHATIEKAKKQKKVYTTSEYKLLSETARLKPRPYFVYHLNYSNFYDFANLANIVKCTDGGEISWHNIKWFRFKYTCTSTVLFKYEITENFQHFNVAEGIINWDAVNLKAKYKSRLSISTAKKEDLLSLLRTNVIPEVYKEFIISLPAASNIPDIAFWHLSEDSIFIK